MSVRLFKNSVLNDFLAASTSVLPLLMLFDFLSTSSILPLIALTRTVLFILLPNVAHLEAASRE